MPVQVTPLPVNPELQVQSKLPIVLLQYAFASQLFNVALAHSSISRKMVRYHDQILADASSGFHLLFIVTQFTHQGSYLLCNKTFVI